MTRADEIARAGDEVRAQFGDENLALIDAVYKAFLTKVDYQALLNWKLPDSLDALLRPVFRSALLAIITDLRLGELADRLNERDRLTARVAQLEGALREILGAYWEKGHVGYAATRTPWFREERLETWRYILAGIPKPD